MLNRSSYFLSVDHYGQVGAGRVVPFTPLGQKWIAPPKNAHPFQPFITYTVSGSSLVERGIIDGDVLICRTVFELSEIKDDTICILLIKETDLMVKMVRFNSDDTVTIRAANPRFPDRIFYAEDVEIKAIVCELQRKV